jgi:threonylcarbamoyladenosine tRNA methylthiotransferase MtaB
MIEVFAHFALAARHADNERMPTFRVINFGCRANQADGSAIEQDLASRGFEPAHTDAVPDVVVLNSCTVTASADYAVRQAARRIHRENPDARIVVTGCYAQRSAEDVAALPGVEYVVGNSHKQHIAQILCQPRSAAQFVPTSELTAKIVRSDIFAHTEFLAAPGIAGVFGGSAHDRTRPNLKIQDGCNNRCSFCVIPYVRGQSRSMRVSEVLKQVRLLAEDGYKEVVLSGINLGRYGRDFDQRSGGRMRFAQLVRLILDETSLQRLRLSSVEPMDFTDELLELMATTNRIAKHVHAPLQSGSDRILRRMHRKYRAQHYRERIEQAFALMPNAAFGADVMVGFPGETDADFEQTRSFIDSLPFTYLHVFPFSCRPGTPADRMDQQVNGAVVRERSRILRELAAEKNRRFRERQVGRALEVVTLNGESDERAGTAGLSENFLDVFVAGERLPNNRLMHVKITGVTETGLTGSQADPPDDGVAARSPSIMTSANA